MPWNRRYAIISYLRSTLWIAPVIAVAIEQLTFRIAYVYQLDFGWLPGFVFPGDATVSVADYVIAVSVAFLVFTFGSLLVAIQVASAQLTPRIIATTLLRDNVIRVTVGLFVYLLLLGTAVKARAETTPHSIVSLTGLLGILAVVAFLFLIDYAARFLRPISIIWRVAQGGLEVIEGVYPQRHDEHPSTLRADEPLAPAQRAILHAGNSAIIIAVNIDALVAAARRARGVIELAHRVGDFVAEGQPLLLLHGKAAVLDDQALRAQIAFGVERTIEQDPTFAFRVIVDIALKALSPAINDPTTAVLAIDQLARLLGAVGLRALRVPEILDEQGRLRVILPTPHWRDFVHLACTEIRHCGAHNVQVSRRLYAMIEDLLRGLPEGRAPALRRQRALLDRATARHHEAEDRALARIPDVQGLGGSSAAPLEPEVLPGRPAAAIDAR